MPDAPTDQSMDRQGNEAFFQQHDLPERYGITPENGERVETTRAALAKLIGAAKEYSHPHNRDKGDETLKAIDLRTFVNEDGELDDESELAFQLTLGYSEATPDDNLMLTLESPLDINRFQFLGSLEAGVLPVGRRIQDYLYKKGSDTVPVRQGDFSYVYDYRPLGSDNYDARKGQLDELLGILANATVVRGDHHGPKVTELAPELANLVESQEADSSK